MAESLTAELRRLESFAHPAWVWAPALRAMPWANRAALALFGATDLLDLAGHQKLASDALAQRLDLIAANAADEPEPHTLPIAGAAGLVFLEVRTARIPLPGEAAAEVAKERAAAPGLLVIASAAPAQVPPHIARLVQTLETAPAPISLYARNGDPLWHNIAAGHLLGSAMQADMTGLLTGAENGHPVTAALARGHSWSGLATIATGAGIRTCRLALQPLDAAAGPDAPAAELTIIAFQDLSAVKAVVDQHEEALEQLRRQLAATSDFQWETDAAGHLTFLSEQTSEVLDRPAEDLIGLSLGNFLSALGAEHPARLERTLARHEPFRHVAVTLEEAPEWRLLLSGAPVFREGRFRGYLGTAIFEEIRIEEALSADSEPESFETAAQPESEPESGPEPGPESGPEPGPLPAPAQAEPTGQESAAATAAEDPRNDIPFADLGPNGEIISASPAFDRLFAADGAAARPRNLAALAGSAFAQVLRPFEDAANGIAAQADVSLNVPKKGRQEFTFRFQPLAGEPDEPARTRLFTFPGLAVDRSRRNEERERQLIDLYEGALPGLLIFSGKAILFANPSCAEYFGYPSGRHMQGPSAVPTLFPEEIERLARLQDTPARVSDLKARRADGTDVWFDGRFQPVEWDGESATQLTLYDVTARRRAQARAQKREEFLARLMEATGCPIFVIDRTATIELANGEADDLIAPPAALKAAIEATPQPPATAKPVTRLIEILDPVTAEDLMAVLHGTAAVETVAAFAEGRPCQLAPLAEARGWTITVRPLDMPADGHYCVTLAPAGTDAEETRRLAGERDRAEDRRARQAAYIAGLVHELRTPLTAILGFADMMRLEQLGPLGHERYREYVRDIHRSGGHLLSLVNDLLDMAKLEAGRMQLTAEPVDLAALADECVSMVRPLAETRHIGLGAACHLERATVSADERALRQVVINLLSNAIKFTPRGGTVRLTIANRPSGDLVLTIADTGEGMTAEELRKALEPFGQAGRPPKSKEGQNGTGLGLPLAKALTEAIGAAFEIESAPGSGTTAHLVFPQALIRPAG